MTGVGLNGVFLYATGADPRALQTALTNPISAAFIVEALLLMVVLAWLLPKWGVSRVSGKAFIVLCLAGGIAFDPGVAVLLSPPTFLLAMGAGLIWGGPKKAE